MEHYELVKDKVPGSLPLWFAVLLLMEDKMLADMGVEITGDEIRIPIGVNEVFAQKMMDGI